MRNSSVNSNKLGKALEVDVDSSGIAMHGVAVMQIKGGTELPIDLSGTEGLILGRSDTKSSFIPDIDLAAHQALDKGVSRRHAALVRYQDRLHILDLSSVNGTVVNGKRLTPETPHPLYIGDQITLAELSLTLMRIER